jgi:hypothetical protein
MATENTEKFDDLQAFSTWVDNLTEFFVDDIYRDIGPEGTMAVLCALIGTVGLRLGYEPKTLQSLMQKWIDTALPHLETIKERNTNVRH